MGRISSLLRELLGDPEPPAGPVEWLVVGLGNPGEEYSLTPHNLGFLVADRLAKRHGIRIRRRQAQARVGTGRIDARRVMVAKPQTFMNRSGPAVKALLEHCALPPQRLVLVHDDLDLPWTGLRIRRQGSAGGHRGVASVIESLASAEFVRVRLGIQPSHPVEDAAKFVLAPIGRAWRKELEELLDYAATAVESVITEGVEKSMTRFNRRARGLRKEEE